jgi:hypothetical protein
MIGLVVRCLASYVGMNSGWLKIDAVEWYGILAGNIDECREIR